MELNTAKVVDNEVVKAVDFDYGFKSFVNNFALGMRTILAKDTNFVVGGTVRQSKAGGMNISVDPVFGYCKNHTVDTVEIVANDELTDLITVSLADSSDRIDIVEICGEYVEYDEQQRAINDAESGIKTYPMINTKQKVSLKVNVKPGIPGDVKAPETTEGYIKIAEIQVKANASEITEENIFNITSDVEKLENENWTNEKDITINIGSISNLNDRFRANHTKDGEHRTRVIHTPNIDFGVSANQVNGAEMPIGGTSVNYGSATINPTDKLTETLSKIAAQFNTPTEILKKVYPVGCLYWTSNSENPATTFGFGSWTQIKDKFVLAAGDSYANGGTGGEASVTLATTNLPSHSHGIGGNTGDTQPTFSGSGAYTGEAGWHGHGCQAGGVDHTHDMLHRHHTDGYTGGITANHTHTFSGSDTHRHEANFYYGSNYVDGSEFNLDSWFAARSEGQTKVEHEYRRKNRTTATTVTISGSTGTVSSDHTHYWGGWSSTPRVWGNEGVEIYSTGTATAYSHTHGIDGAGTHTHYYAPSGTVSSHSHSLPASTGATGSGVAHNNMPPYVVKFCWERIA